MALLLLGGATPRCAATPQISTSVWQQIQTLLDEKAARTPVQQKIGSQLLQALKTRRQKAAASGLRSLGSNLEPRSDDITLVDITAPVTTTLLTAIEQAGGTIVTSVPSYQAIRARVSLSQIEALASRPDIRAIRPAIRAITAQRTYPLTAAVNVSEGDIAHQADVVRRTFDIDGTDVKIGVLSDSVDFLATVQASGDLPEVTVRPGQSGLDDPEAKGEGTAMLEIVYDLAPGAGLFFATAFGSPAAFAQNIRDLRFVAGCDILVDDVLYFDESPFQDGIIAQAVNEVTANGALYFSSAGNEGNQNDGTSGVWEGDFVDAGPFALLSGGTVHDFGGSSTNQLTDDAPDAVTLFWSDPLGGSGNDYDLFILDANLTTVLASSTDIQNGDDDPFEIITDASRRARCPASSHGLCAARQGERLVVLRKTGAAARFLHLNTNRGQLAISTAGQTRGHNSAVDAFGIAAVDVATAAGGVFGGGAANPVETSSSDGPRRMFYLADGTPITPGDLSSTGGAVRHKPDLAAADGVRTATPGFRRFFGTSAAAPHAAGIAALVKEANPMLTPAEMRTVLTTTARDIEAVGIDRDSGAGLVDALAAVEAALENEPLPDTCQTCLITAGLVVGTVLTGPGTTITVPVEVRNAPNAIGALGFEVTFDPTLLQFTGSTAGALTANQHFIIGAALVEPGRIRIGGFTRQNDIADGSNGHLLDLHFDVFACQQDQAFPLTLERLVDDVATWDTCAGCVTCSCLPNGDANQDGRLTPADALLTFQHFLDLIDFPLDACQQAHADVYDPLGSDITPSDPLCIFRKFLGLPSCLD